MQSEQPLWHDMPVRPIEEEFLHMVILAGSRWARRVFVIEHELGGPVAARFQEAHPLPIIGRLFWFWFLPTHNGNQALCQHPGLEVRCRTALGYGEIGGVTQRVHMGLAFDLQGAVVCRQPGLFIAQARILDDLRPSMWWHQNEQVVVYLLPFQR